MASLAGTARWAVLSSLALAAASCGEKVQANYTIDLRGPASAFAGASTAILEGGGRELARVSVRQGAPVDLNGTALDPMQITEAVFRLRTVDAMGKLVGYGQTPPLEIVRDNYTVRIFVQRPATAERVLDLELPRKDHVAVDVSSVPTSFPEGQKLTTSAVIFGTGLVRLPGNDMDGFSDGLLIYNPLTHFIDPIGATPALAGQRQVRTGAAAIARPDGRVMIFGGFARVQPYPDMVETKVTSQLDVFRLRRDDLLDFGLETPAVFATQEEGVARAETVLVQAGGVLAVGGRDTMSRPLDTIVAINIDSMAVTPMRLLAEKLSTPRAGHLGVGVQGKQNAEAMVFGGGAAGTPAADVIEGTTPPRLVAFTGDPGPNRTGHGALALNDQRDRVLVFGGVDEGGQVRGDGVLYNASTRTFEATTFTLRTPRRHFTTFVLNDDIVVSGGYGADGMLLGTAEIYDRQTLAFVSEIIVTPRARATASPLPINAVAIVGGEVANSVPSVTVELYQPRRM